jgi:hypothetical protein
VIVAGATVADTLYAELYSVTDAAVLIAGVTVAAVANATELVSAWTTFPASTKACYVRTQNQAAARGTCAAAYVELGWQ